MNGPLTTFLKYKAIHPNSHAKYVPTPANLKAWEYAIKSSQSRVVYQTVEIDTRLLDMVRAMYRVHSFIAMPYETQQMYLRIAACYPGYKVFACGSRVRGDYIDGSHESIVIDARVKAGMRARAKSDFDFWVEPDAEQVGELPPGADRCRLRIPENEKILIPHEH